MEATGKSTEIWVDGKRYAWLFGLLIPVLPSLSYLLVAATDLSLFWWTGPILYFVVIPILEVVIGVDAANPPESAVAGLENDRYYRWCVYFYIPLQYLSLICAVWVVATQGLAWYEWLGLMLTTGLANGVGINTAHELGHKKEVLERWLSRVALAPVAYGHFYVEHNRGHHVRVATPEDPASSRFGENFWSFLPRTVAGSLRSAWEIESQRLARLGKSAWTLQNNNLSAWLMTIALFGVLTVVFGWSVLPFLIAQAIYGLMQLEVVNYIEHYGLVRQKTSDGRYERCQPRHSWNSNHLVTNLLLYHLQRHSDHHANPTRRYQALRHFDEAPQLPSGYTSMILLAYVPPLWRRVMDPRVLKHYRGDIQCVNIQPSVRAQVLAQYGQSKLSVM